jgi:hypothetical protein
VPGTAGGRLSGRVRDWAVETRRSGVPGSARETITGERMLRFVGHLITSRIDEKRSTYPSMISTNGQYASYFSN